MNTMKMIFAFEGHNGVGKSSIAKEVAKKINAKYLYGVDQDVLKRDLKETFIKDAYWYASALFFLSGNMETKRKIENVYKEDVFVIDRSYWSTLAVHWDRDKDDVEAVKSIIKNGEKFLPIPNIIFILTADYNTCKERIDKKTDKVGKDLDSVVDEKYYTKEKNFYKWLATNNTNSEFVTIDTTNLSEKEVVDICIKNIKSYMEGIDKND